jgi:glycosyltransferase involved in cell wall biosynthesis
MDILDFFFYAFIVVVIIQVTFYLIIFQKFAFLKPEKKRRKTVPVSVIVCAKNEAENLLNFLPSIISQDYKDFEIVLINDASSDNTLEIMEDFSKKHEHVKIVDVKNNEAFWGNKKYALTLGIKTSKYDQLLFTDADCKPLSNQWIKEMTFHFTNDHTIVLGYSGYSKVKKSFLNKLIRFETLITAIQYFSFAKIGLPYMGVGRNLAYTKKSFFDANGFVDHIKLPSGDDDLFINQIASNKNTAICFSKESFTESVPKSTFKTWIKQKRRHISTAKHYKLKHKLLLALFYSSNLLFWFLSLLLFVEMYHWQYVIGLFVFRLLIQYLVLSHSSEKLDEKDLLIWFPVLEIALIIIQLVIFINNLISKPNFWK